MAKGAIYLGIILILSSLFLFYLTKFFIIGLIYGIILIIVGICLIIFYKEEDKIEERKDLKSSKSK